jgi:hypothetical protein
MKKSLLKRFLLTIWFAPIVIFPLAQIRLSLIMALADRKYKLRDTQFNAIKTNIQMRVISFI